ncbi:SusC/RagA family TonB-linked outer membrane protein [Alkalitalea saponilacus]|nr:SusC/RagA family TonB-linked outer membrane protein [Alkalitalea saponilacus]
MKINFSALTFILCMLFLCGDYMQAQESNVVVQGTVTSSTDGETLIGVNVIEIDNTNRMVGATVTDLNGRYLLVVRNPQNRLVFSFISFVSQSIEVGDQRRIDVQLQEEVQELMDVTITAERTYSDGAFAIPQREISMAMSTISSQAFEGVQVTSLDDALQGRVPGFDIVGSSGDPGSGSTMRIRGTASINANAQPLIVLNGIPYEQPIDPNFDFSSANEEQFANMLSINPDDIEEITVLRDAASTAIWGSRGANGVLQIRTKEGTRGPTRVQYSYRMTRATIPQGIRMLTGDDYTMMIRQAYFNPFQNEAAANIPELMYDPTFPEYQNFNNNVNWFDEVTRTGYKHDHYITLTGGGERARFRVSGGFLEEQGTVIGNSLSRISSRAYLDYAVSNRIRFISEFSFTYTNHDRPWRENNEAPTILDLAYRKMPNVSVYQQDLQGNSTNIYYNISRDSDLHPSQRDMFNPVAVANLATSNIQNYRILPTFRLQYDMLPRTDRQMLRYNMFVSFDVNNDKTSRFLPAEASNMVWTSDRVNLADHNDSENVTVYTDHNISWQPNIANPNHFLLLYGSVQATTGSNMRHRNATANLPSGQIVDASALGFINDFNTDRYSYRSNALLLRGHYSYLSRYILSAVFRRDGSTKFGANYKYGNFPGVSAKWIISDEMFMDFSNNWLSMLAIRPSWGITGNQPVHEYLHFSRYSPYGSYMDMSATRPSTLQLSDLRWETTTSLNYGFDIGFLDDRYNLKLDFYNQRTEDLLMRDLSIPSSSGHGLIPWQNVGTMDNKGWEVELWTSNAIRANDWTIDFNFNIANFVNTIVELRDDILDNYNSDFNFENGSYLTRVQEGNPFGSIYGFRFKGVYQYDEYIQGVQESAPVARDRNGNVILDANGVPLPMMFAFGRSNQYQFRGGDAIYEDINNDGSIDELDIVYLGDSNPDFSGGFGATIRFRNWRMTPFFNFRVGHKIVNEAKMHAENMYTNNNQSTAVNWRWRKDGDETEIPRALFGHGYNWLGSDRFVEDGSFLRFRHLTINYSVPSNNLNYFRQLSFYLTINNLYVWTNYSGVDPEVGTDWRGIAVDRSHTPRSRDFTLGVTAIF